MLNFRKANEGDVNLLFEWANDELVRANSFNQEPILFNDHAKWFAQKLKDEGYTFLVFINDKNEPVGLVRFHSENGNTVIGISVGKNHRGKSYATKMLVMATEHFHQIKPQASIFAYIKTNNLHSYHIFLNAGFQLQGTTLYNNKEESFKLTKYK